MNGETDEQSTALSLLTGLAGAGYEENFIFRDGKVTSTRAHRQLEPSELSIDGIFRFEGPSDPDNMSIIYAIRTRTGSKGLLMDAFGPSGNMELADFMAKVEDCREVCDILDVYPLARTFALPPARSRTPRSGPPMDSPDSQG